MLYEQSRAPALDDALFADPPAAYRGAPFWGWNCRVTPELVRDYIPAFREMGFGGFHIHSRTGMDTPYMSEAFLALVKTAVEEAQGQGLQAFLYDEDRWPSGAAGGLVTRHKPFRERRLCLVPEDRDDDLPLPQALEEGAPYYLQSYAVTLAEDGTLLDYRTVPRTQQGAGVWHAFVLPGEESPWFNNQAYSDTMNPQAVDAFLQITHGRYAAAVGEFFGKTVPALFTDEPRPAFRRRFTHARGHGTAELAWTPDFPETFAAAYGYSLPDKLPEVFWDLPDGALSQVRYHYHDHAAERFAAGFCDRCAAWCAAHGLLLTGHMLMEDTLADQTAAAGEVMRCYRSFPVPGIDILCDRMHLNTAKQVQSAVHQYGREGALSELYGVTNWDFDFRGHKFQGDWQAALGITLRVPHLSWLSMGGEAKRDYPASIGPQSPWYREYRFIEDHFARLNTVLTRGRPLVRVGMIHPIESFWCLWGPNDTGAAAREEAETHFRELTGWLLRGGVDFDFISEASLPKIGGVKDGQLTVGEMAYATVLVPGCLTLRGTTAALLKRMEDAGGRVLFVGEAPRCIDARPSGFGAALAGEGRTMPFTKTAVLAALREERDYRLENADGTPCESYLHQLRADGEDRWLFLAPCEKPACVDTAPPKQLRLILPGAWQLVRYDTLTGHTAPLPAAVGPDGTQLEITLYPYESLLMRLRPAAEEPVQLSPAGRYSAGAPRRYEMVAFTRAEPNVLLLDTAEWALDAEDWSPPEEILRIDNTLRRQLNFPLRTNKWAQPWVTPECAAAHAVRLRYTVHSACSLAGVSLALERPEQADIRWNGQPVETVPDGWYVDHAIRTVPLPEVREGENVLELCLPFAQRTQLESLYLLGDFDVQLAGARAVLTPPRREIGFSSLTMQGMPFYGGNVTYHLPVEVPSDGVRLRVHAGCYRGALIGVSLDGEPAGRIVLPPYDCVIDGVRRGAHMVELTLYGNRFNTFGALHNINTADTWYGFMYWRSAGDGWSYEYHVRDTGILSSPAVTLEYPDRKAGER